MVQVVDRLILGGVWVRIILRRYLEARDCQYYAMEMSRGTRNGGRQWIW